MEVSSHRLLNYSGTTDTRAPKGTVGTLLLDPENYYVNANGLPPNSDPTASAISADALIKQLVSNNVVLSTLPSGTNAGDIFVDANISWSTGNSLTLSAYHDILFMSGSKVTSTGPGNLVLRADNTGTGQGTIVFNPGGHVDFTQSTGTVSLFYNPSGPQTTKYQNPTNYFCPPCPGGGGVFVRQPSQLTAYMLVNTASDLDAVRTNQSGTYALGTKIYLRTQPDFHAHPEFHRAVRRPGSDHRQPDDRVHSPERWAVRQHWWRRRGPQPQPDRRHGERPKLPICRHAGGNERGNNQQRLRHRSSARGQWKHRGRPGRTKPGHNRGCNRAGADPALRRRSNLRIRRGERGVERDRRRARRLQQRHHHECVRDRRRHRRGRHQWVHDVGRARRE